MPAISTSQITQFAQQRFQQISLPQGTDRTRFANYIGTMCGLIGDALNTWRTSARLSGVRVMGPVAIGGKLYSPVSIEGLIRPRAPAGWEAYNQAVAAGVHNQVQTWANGVMVPSLPWWPAFAAFPGPTAPPMPNVPTPLVSLPSTQLAAMTERPISDMIYNKMGNPKPACGKDVAVAIGFGLQKAFALWLASQQVTNVMGKGPVPTFAPPYIPAGPVVGNIVESGTHLST